MKRVLAVAAIFTMAVGCGFLAGCGELGAGLAAAPTVAGDTSDGPFGSTPGCVDCGPGDPIIPIPSAPQTPLPPEACSGLPRLQVTCEEELGCEAGRPCEYDSSKIDVAGGSGEYEIEWKASRLPEGMTATESGVSGTPTELGRWSFRFIVTESQCQKRVRKTVTLNVSETLSQGKMRVSKLNGASYRPVFDIGGNRTHQPPGFALPRGFDGPWDAVRPVFDVGGDRMPKAPGFALPRGFDGPWSAVYKIEYDGAAEGYTWKLNADEADKGNVCFQASKPNLSTEGGEGDGRVCETQDNTGTITNAKAVYLFLKENKKGFNVPPLRLRVSVSKEGTELSKGFKFDYKTSFDLASVFTALNGSAVKSVKVEIVTGKLTESIGTDGDIRISFGKQEGDLSDNPSWSLCKNFTDPSWVRKTRMGGTHQFTIEPADACRLTTEDLKYFRIQLISSETDLWLLQEIKVLYQLRTDDESTWHLAYWNPYLLRFLAGNSTGLLFGPANTAVGVITQVSNTAGDAGTGDPVWLVFEDEGGFDTQNGSMWWCDDGFEIRRVAYREITTNFCSPSFRSGADLRMRLDWEPYDDFREGMETSYGDYVFDSDPFAGKKPAGVRITKDKSDGLSLDDANIYVFHPASSFTLREDGSIAINGADPVWHARLPESGVTLDNEGGSSLETDSMKFKKITPDPDDQTAFDTFRQGGGHM